MRRLKEKHWQPGQSTQSELCSVVRGWLREWSNFVEHAGVLYRRVEDSIHGKVLQLLVPEVLKKTVLDLTHDQWGHQGVQRTLSLLKERCYWPGMTHDVKEYIRKCFNHCDCVSKPTSHVRTPQRHVLAFLC